MKNRIIIIITVLLLGGFFYYRKNYMTPIEPIDIYAPLSPTYDLSSLSKKPLKYSSEYEYLQRIPSGGAKYDRKFTFTSVFTVTFKKIRKGSLKGSITFDKVVIDGILFGTTGLEQMDKMFETITLDFEVNNRGKVLKKEINGKFGKYEEDNKRLAELVAGSILKPETFFVTLGFEEVPLNGTWEYQSKVPDDRYGYVAKEYTYNEKNVMGESLIDYSIETVLGGVEFVGEGKVVVSPESPIPLSYSYGSKGEYSETRKGRRIRWKHTQKETIKLID